MSAKRIFVTALVLLGHAGSHGEGRPALEFKGLAPGADARALVATPPWRCSPSHSMGGDTLCINLDETIAGARASIVSARLKSGLVLTASVLFKHDDYRRVRDALVAKYGPPDTVDVVELTTMAGVRIKSERVSWAASDAVLLLREHGPKIDTTSLFLAGPQLQQADIEQRVEQSKKNKSDL